jgi:hypothetical protein
LGRRCGWTLGEFGFRGSHGSAERLEWWETKEGWEKQKEKAGLGEECYEALYSGIQYWEDEDDEYHWLVFSKKKATEREVRVLDGKWSDEARKLWAKLPNSGFPIMTPIPRPHALSGYRNAGMDFHSFLTSELNAMRPSQAWHSCQFCSDIPLDRLLRLPSERYKFSQDVTDPEGETRPCPLYMAINSSIQLHNVPNGKEVELFIEIPALGRASEDSIPEAPHAITFPR